MIRTLLFPFLAREISVAELRQAASLAAWHGDDLPTTADEHLLGEIEVLLLEFENGAWSEDELREEVDHLAGIYRVGSAEPIQSGARSTALRTSTP